MPQVTGLEVGSTYIARVRPVNAAGVGMASMTSDSVTTKAVEGNCFISVVFLLKLFAATYVCVAICRPEGGLLCGGREDW